MRNLCLILLGLFVLCTFTTVNAQSSCDLKPFNIAYTFPTNVSNYALTLNNLGSHNIKLVPGISWQFFIDSSLDVPSITVTVDQKSRTINMVVDDATADYIKQTGGSSSLVPSATVLLAGLALVFGGNKKYLVLLGLFLCFAASVMAFDACNTVLIVYPAEMGSADCDNIKCVGCEQISSRRETRDTCATPAPGATQAPATQAPAPATQAPAPAVTQAPATQAPATKAPAPATQAPAPAVTQAPVTPAPTTAPTTAPTPPTGATQRPISVPTQAAQPLTCTNYLQSGPGQYYNDAHLCTTTYLPYTLSLSSNVATLEQQVNSIMSQSSYNDPTVYSPTPATNATYQASFYPQQRLYQNNPTQILIGLTDVTHNMNLIQTKLRLPSIYFGMFLAYAMDHFGMDPHFLLAQAGKESAATMVDPSFTQNFLTCANGNIATGGCSGQVYDCRATYNVGDPAIQGVTHQGCPAVDNFGIALGPFQIETEGFAQVASVAPHRFWVETATRTAVNTPLKTPLFMESSVIALTSTNIKSLQANYTSHNSDSLAIVGAGLYHHWVHNVIMNFNLVNYRAAFNIRNSAQQSELAFATILYLYNRGMYSPLDFSTCQVTDDPTSSPNCVTSNGFGAYAAQIKAGTFALEQAQNVYDFPIQWSDIEYFISQLQLSYPYQCVACDLDGSYGNIDWDEVLCESYLMYEKLAAARANNYNANVKTGISFRYDWRLMLAVIRSFLPGRDLISGPDFAPWSVRAGANGIANLASDPGPYASAPSGQASWTSPAGQRATQMEQCPCDDSSSSAPAQTSAPAPAQTSAPVQASPPKQNNLATVAPTSASQTGSTSCSPDGTICTSVCSTTWYMCSGGKPYGQQSVPAGTLCYQGQFVHSNDPRCA